MQAAQRAVLHEDWIAFLFLFILVLLGGLKLANSYRFNGVLFSFLNKGYIKEEIEEKPKSVLYSFFFYLVSIISISLAIYFLITNEHYNHSYSLREYMWVFGFTALYFLVKNSLELAFASLLGIKSELNFYFSSKQNYLHTISIALFFVLIVFYYSFNNFKALFLLVILLLLIRIILIANTNKSLIVKNMYYFILYLCAFEIVPLSILIKLIT